jgi:hypothetical protein
MIATVTRAQFASRQPAEFVRTPQSSADTVVSAVRVTVPQHTLRRPSFLSALLRALAGMAA